MGRWIDFDHDYKTMDCNFMESVWWVFQRLFEKGLVYRGFKVMPYSTACTTPLSNFEANQNYKDVKDPTAIVRFPLEEDPNVSLLAWYCNCHFLPELASVMITLQDHYALDLTEQLSIMCESHPRLCSRQGHQEWPRVHPGRAAPLVALFHA